MSFAQSDPAIEYLTSGPLPEVAAALRARQEQIVEVWNKAVKASLPDADPLTAMQVRDSIPAVLEKIALALESPTREATDVLAEVGVAHGVARFQQHFKIEELLTEYRLLRKIVFEQLHEVSHGMLTFREGIAVHEAIDLAMHRGVAEFVRSFGEQLQAANAAEANYLAFLSHDLRNSLNSIVLEMELIGRSLSDDPKHAQSYDDVKQMQRSVHQTIEGMERLMQAERLRRQAVKLRLGPVALHKLVDELIRQQSHAAAEKSLRLVNDVDPKAAAHSDRELVTLALQNLLGNAVKFSQRGTIRLAAKTDPQGWRISVSDEGPGIAPERIETLFQAFSRGETHGQPGLGLGLTIASHAARLLGTELQVESTLGKGSTFSFVLSPV